MLEDRDAPGSAVQHPEPSFGNNNGPDAYDRAWATIFDPSRYENKPLREIFQVIESHLNHKASDASGFWPQDDWPHEGVKWLSAINGARDGFGLALWIGHNRRPTGDSQCFCMKITHFPEDFNTFLKLNTRDRYTKETDVYTQSKCLVMLCEHLLAQDAGACTDIYNFLLDEVPRHERMTIVAAS